MKLATQDRPIERITTAPERAFTIKATGKAFRILSSGLYKNKPLAIVRELSCNAYDAHVAAGKREVPFEVHLPSRFEAWLSVRDYGKALSPDQIATVFTVYFESTKTDNNDEVGGLGLGCKSPLSYVDSFTVISRYEGVKRIYTVFFNEDETPSIVEMSAESTDEPTGLEVQLPVRDMDIYDFKNCAQRVFRYFPTPPIVTGNAEYKLTKPIVRFAGSDYSIVDREENGARAIMGTVSYPIASEAVGSSSSNTHVVYNANLDIQFKIGDLDITAGREELSYDKKTKEILSKRADAIVHDLTRRILREMRACENEFEARKYYGNTITPHSIARDLFPEGKVPYRDGFISKPTFTFNMTKQFESGGEIKLIEIVSTRKTPKQTIYSRGAQHEPQRSVTIYARDDITFIEDDEFGKYLNSRYIAFVEGKSDHPTYVLRGLEPEEIKFLSETFPKAEFVKLSSLPKPLRASSARLSPSVLSLSEHRRTNSNHKIARHDWNRVTVDMEQGGVFILMANGQPEYNDRPITEFSRIYSLATQMGLIDRKQEIFAVSKSIEKREKFSTREDEGWLNFFDVISAEFRKQMIEKNWSEAIAKNRRIQEYSSANAAMNGNGQKIISSIARKMSEEHPLNKFITALGECSNGRAGADHPSEMSRLLGIMLPPADAPDVLGLWKSVQFSEKYPMAYYAFDSIRYASSSTSFTDVTDRVEQYILLCDKNCDSIEP